MAFVVTVSTLAGGMMPMISMTANAAGTEAIGVMVSGDGYHMGNPGNANVCYPMLQNFEMKLDDDQLIDGEFSYK